MNENSTYVPRDLLAGLVNRPYLDLRSRAAQYRLGS